MRHGQSLVFICSSLFLAASAPVLAAGHGAHATALRGAIMHAMIPRAARSQTTPSIAPPSAVAPVLQSPAGHETQRAGEMRPHHQPNRHRPTPVAATPAAAAGDGATSIVSATIPALTGVPPSTASNPAAAAPTPTTPQSPPLDTTTLSSGGASTTDTSGGGGRTIAECMELWDNSSHMSRTEWRSTCRRTLNGLDLPIEN